MLTIKEMLREGASIVLPVQRLLYTKSAHAFVAVTFGIFAIFAFYFLGSALAVPMVLSSASGCTVCDQQPARQCEYTPYTSLRFADNIWSC